MGRKRLTDCHDFRFKDLDLSGNLVAWNDKIGIRLAGHEYLKRDGAEQEHMGSSPGSFRVRLVFVGDAWARQYRALVASIRKEPRGRMIHPLLGEMQVACAGIEDASVEPGQELDTIHVSMTFVEDAVDATIAAEQFEAPSAKQSKVTALSSSFSSAAAKFATAASKAAALTAAASSFATAAVSAAQTNTPDPSLGGKLETVRASAASVIAAIKADPVATSTAKFFEAVDLAERLLDACVQLDESVAASRPVIVSYVVPATVHYMTLMAQLYGKDAQAQGEGFLTLNRVATPHAIPAGTKLQIVAPTV